MRTCASCGASLADDASFCPYDGTRLDAGTGRGGDPLIGALVDQRYRVLAFLGAGGMARVYLAQHVALARDVALKVLAPELAADPRLVTRFAREARMASAIDHDNVICVSDFGRDQGRLYLVMEYVPGRALDAELARVGTFGAERAAHVLSQIAAGTGRAHQLGIVHRDLKPENVMLCQRGSDPDFVKILDFGLGKPIAPDEGEPRLTGPLELFGTPHYMAPERWSSAAPDVRSDVYALGVIGYELLTGALPFNGPLVALMYQHLETAPPPIRDAHPAIAAFVLKCLEKDPSRRFATMDDTLEGLRDVWSALPRQTRRTTYAGASVRPRTSGADDLSDPTAYDSRTLDPAWDGPALVEEVRRLHRLRRRYLDELARGLWGPSAPPTLAPLLARVAAADAAIDAAMEQIALVDAAIEERARAAREEEAQLRLHLIDANLALTLQDTLSSEGDAVDVEAITTETSDARARQRGAERRLGSLIRRVAVEQLALRTKLADGLATVCRLEEELAPVVEDVSAAVQAAARERPELRAALRAYLTVDGALASYQGLLDALRDASP